MRVIPGDCRAILPTLPDASVQCCVTSPPYYGLRDYGVDGQIGLEPGKILMLTLLAPDIVEAIMDGRQPAELGVHVLREGFPVEWGEQWAHSGFTRLRNSV